MTTEKKEGMSLGWKVVGGVLIGALVFGPLGAIIGGAGTYAWNTKDKIIVEEKK